MTDMAFLKVMGYTMALLVALSLGIGYCAGIMWATQHLKEACYYWLSVRGASYVWADGLSNPAAAIAVFMLLALPFAAWSQLSAWRKPDADIEGEDD